MVMEDLDGAIPELSWEQFEPYLPPKCVDTLAVKARLELSGAIVDNRWAAYRELDPSKMDGHQDAVFAPLELIVKTIISECLLSSSFDQEQTLELMLNPDQVPICSERKNNSRPDGALRLPGPLYLWNGIGVSKELKKFGGVHVYDNRRQVVWSMHHILRDDPTRRFTFAITTEDTQMRLWFCSRSVMVATKSFNFVTDLEKVIRIYSSFAFATKPELGWDPTIRVVPNTNPTRYDIDVHTDGEDKPVTYRNAQIIWDYGAESLHCRATRVFKTTDPATGAPVAVKDVWRDYDRPSEGANVDMIMGEIDRRGGRFADFKKYFMQVERHGDVRINGQVDDTHQLIMRDTPVPPNHSWLPLIKPSKLVDVAHGDRPMLDGLETTDRTRAQNQQLEVRRRVHYRIVFAHVGTPIYQLPSLKDRCRVLIDSLKGLEALYRLGYLHRDVSTGNILCVRDASNNLIGKLSDLEYIMAIDSDNPARGVRTGTVDFMAVEVDRMAYIFRPQDVEKQDEIKIDPSDVDNWGNYEDEDKETTSEDERKEVEALKEQIRLAFRHNPIHDVESHWWIMAWNLFAHAPTSYLPSPPTANSSVPASESTWHMGDQLVVSNRLFPGTIRAPYRREMFTKEVALDTTVLPAEIQPLVRHLVEAQDKLLSTYKLAEKPPTGIDESLYLRIHSSVIRIFKKIMDSAGDIQVASLSKFQDPEEPTHVSGKRKADAPRTNPPAPKKSKN
ncbi:hypothetical protein PLICRDRAFT_365367 [Plicaturopsis crispa FD-325 SS-3]|uniref:Fungal-type protein kinase domain-containing protein n=1 Tax=Plicaturopsis crispa FD-325 SS-3 TaxID=944288 RepID=A0A0C9SKW2_PLICR|nr:hypothetical protein PLICRDRAFT_365367 [Plicaturopsis crispa FD-325 SS-3]